MRGPWEKQMKTYELKINGGVHKAEVEEDTPMLWVLRDALGLMGTKFGCGVGQCGACTIHLNGQAVRSCTLPVESVGNAEVTTIEGLAEEGELTPLQAAWCEHDVAQCGYCQAGQIMSAAALLKAHPHPEDSQIDEAMAGNFCRCATYARIREAIHTAAAR
nr:(2Fe-2S)-binding protein [Haloferula luteola]